MTKRKLQRFAENALFRNVFQPVVTYPPVDDAMKGNWNKQFFRNDHPLIVELGCGRGEYTIRLAELFPENNYVGIDFKGARLWRGAKTAQEQHMEHVAFLRIQIQLLESFFGPGEVSEIWITFPDPQPQKSREQKRLTSPRFLSMYKTILKKSGIVHLKTDHRDLYEYTLETAGSNDFKVMDSIDDVYFSGDRSDVLGIKTTYEKIFLKQGARICYLKLGLV